jgi:hypothetical protein
MKIRLFILGVITAVGLPLGAQEVPVSPESSGLQPRSATIYINNLDTINNLSVESLGVAVTSGGNVLVGWEDDGEGLEDLAAVWTLYDAAGNPLTPNTEITSELNPGTIMSRFLSYFRADGSATPGATSWGPKIKANLFGPGMGMGATSYDLGYEVEEWFETQIQDDATAGDFPSVQLLTDSGEPTAIVAGVTDEYAGRPGDIRIADWDFLSDGNVVIVGESRQGQDLVDLYGGAGSGNHAIFRIVDPSGNEVKAVTVVTETPEANEMWHGVGVTANGFAIRFAQGGRAKVRMFDNAGNPTTGNLDLGTLTGFEITASGGRGDGAGFHGNGVDAYVLANSGTQDGTNAVWVTVLNADGTVRWSKSAADDLVIGANRRVDAGIDKNGDVVVVFSDAQLGNPQPFVMGRRFDFQGEPVGSSFFVSELEDPTQFAVLTAESPRVALRDGLLAVVWQSDNDFDFGTQYTAVALRVFAMYRPGTLESVGLTRLVDDTPIIVPTADALGNWEPYASVLGTSTFLIEGNTFAEGGVTDQRYVVALQPAAGGAMSLAEGFFSDDGQPFRGKINYSRQNGNPGRVAGDKRPGAVNFMVGGEASPHVIPEFQSDNRWNLGFDRLADGRYATVQIFAIDPSTLSQTMLSKAQDSATGRVTSGTAPGNQVSRFGGDIVCLDNGNFVSVVEDRSNVFFEGTATVATIFAPDGSIVKDSFLVFGSDIWANVAAFKGGFAVRAGDGAGGRAIYLYDNDGNATGEVNQSTSGVVFDGGRGDGTRLAGHINSPYVYLAGRESGGTDVKIAVWDSRDASFVVTSSVNEAGFAADADRANLAVDALDRFTVSWVVRPEGYEQQQVAARVLELDAEGGAILPLTATFLPFINVGETNGIRTLQMTVAMTTKEICVGAKGEINLENDPEAGANSPTEVNFYTVFTHPAPADDPTTPVGGVVDGPELAVSVAGNQLTISWPAAEGFTLEQADSISGASWSAGPAGNPVTVEATESARYYRLVRP